VVAISAFGLLRTIVDAWYAGVEGSSSTRLIVRSAISLTLPLPLNYAQRLPRWRACAGQLVELVRRHLHHRAQLLPAVRGRRPQLPAAVPRVQAPRRRAPGLPARPPGRAGGPQAGRQVRLEGGRQIPLRGTIYPGTWTFTLRGIWDGADAKTSTRASMLMHWAYLNESIRAALPRPGRPGGRVRGRHRDPANAARSRQRIDKLFATRWPRP
jgi:putative ABC transport system permease protein